MINLSILFRRYEYFVILMKNYFMLYSYLRGGMNMNSVTLVGRLTQEPEVKENTDGTSRTIINLAVSRDYRNSDGLYETDFIKCVLWNGMASAAKEYCHKGDVVGIKGRIQTRTYEDEEKKKHIMEVVVDKVSFISSVNAKKAEN